MSVLNKMIFITEMDGDSEDEEVANYTPLHELYNNDDIDALNSSQLAALAAPQRRIKEALQAMAEIYQSTPTRTDGKRYSRLDRAFTPCPQWLLIRYHVNASIWRDAHDMHTEDLSDHTLPASSSSSR